MTTLAVVLLVVAGVIVVASLARGISRYRSVMRREWPKVPPRNDDDW
ncbi:MAG: hypothetical protein ICV67_05495 [Thermoleophilia bacterium]|nr:hypothetical protein [Thermoleophilia bacterium]